MPLKHFALLHNTIYFALLHNTICVPHSHNFMVGKPSKYQAFVLTKKEPFENLSYSLRSH